MTRAVKATAELHRIIALPRRTWTPAAAEDMARELTELLKTSGGSMVLRPFQGATLYEIGTYRGAFVPATVGIGKTLVSLLAGYVLDAQRPMLLVPAKLRDKTRREMRLLAQHWRIPPVRIESYETLGRVRAATTIEEYAPDLIVADESHRLKNPRAAVTRRVLRYLVAHPECAFVALSGTITTRSVRDFAHTLSRALGPEHSPLPTRWTDLEAWCGALDERPRDPGAVWDIGALRQLGPPGTVTDLDSARRAVRIRMVETPGVMATDQASLGTSLYLSRVPLSMGPAVESALTRLRSAWELPDGQPLADGLAVWRHARELALGFYYTWKDPPPRGWLDARKEWCATSRGILGNNRRDLDSELAVVNAIDDGHYPAAVGALARWRAIKPSYTPVTVPVWLSDVAVDHVRGVLAGKDPTIIWVEHNAFGERFGEHYYGAQGRNSKRIAIEDADPRKSLVASVASNFEGRNLQAWSRNTITSAPANGRILEQLLGRTHRDGQLAEEVEVDILVTCREHEDAMGKAIADAKFIFATTGGPQKVLYADSDWST